MAKSDTLSAEICRNCGKPKAEHFFCNGYSHGHCANDDGSWHRTSLYEPRKTPSAETLSETRQKFEEYYEEAYAGELKSILERQAAWKFWKDGRLQGLEEAAQIAEKFTAWRLAAAIREKANG